MTKLSLSEETTSRWLRGALGLYGDATPFPWQENLLELFRIGQIQSLDIPTGLGKTASMGIWLVARACGAPVPRRLVYVVDRRAVVDQATEEAVRLRWYVADNPDLREALQLGSRDLPVSTLRGQFIDNKEWLEDPSLPAIIVGTVDMVGSRLLFEGYGVSRKMRPYHAGLFGADTLIMLDEAHLVPPFERLLHTIVNESGMFGAVDESHRTIIPALKVMPLSATSRIGSDKSLGLTEADFEHPVVNQRLNASKHITLVTLNEKKNLRDALAEHAWRLTAEGKKAVRFIVFCNSRDDTEYASRSVKKLAKSSKSQADVNLLVGARRLFERENATKWLKEHGFIAGNKVQLGKPAFVFATSAGEVGIDLDADHMVCDLVAWERMAQRLGRVNRRGEGNAEVTVLIEPMPEEVMNEPPEKRTPKERDTVAKYETEAAQKGALCSLPTKDGALDGSPGAILDLKKMAGENTELEAILNAATTPAPLRPALTRALVDAWSMTSIKEHTGRPEISPWLRGWVTDKPQTSIIWRNHLPVGEPVTKTQIEAFFEAAPPHMSEILETETYRAIDWLKKRAEAYSKDEGTAKASSSSETLIEDSMEETSAQDGSNEPRPQVRSGDDVKSDKKGHLDEKDTVAFVLSSAGDLRGELRIRDLLDNDKKKNDRMFSTLAGATLIVNARFGGLSQDGLLDNKVHGIPRTADDGEAWMSAGDPSQPVIHFRVGNEQEGQTLPANANWRERLRIPVVFTEEGEPTVWLIVDNWRQDAATEDGRSVSNAQLLEEHEKQVEAKACKIAKRLGIPRDYAEMLATAARLHDEGKGARRWQLAFNSPGDGIYAKTQGPVNVPLLDGYRHETGTLTSLSVEDGRLERLPVALKDLALYLIGSHHGFARPVINTSGCELPPSAIEGLAQDIALRFARLQKRWGPWGLAWWEVLLRAADRQASDENDSGDLHREREK